MSGCHPTDSTITIDDKIEFLKKLCNGLDYELATTIERINKLEAHINKIHEMLNIEDRITSKDVLDRIASLENGFIRRIGHLGEALHCLSEENSNLRKKPHKCPNCDFTGAIMLEGMHEVSRFGKDVMKTDDGRYFIWCIACKGNGIVWG